MSDSPSPQDNLKPLDYKEQFRGQGPSKFIDPCAAAAKASLECMTKNDFDREKCLEYFGVYRDCKSTWIEQRKDDRRNGRPTS